MPAEIGHATYSEPLLEALCRHFDRVHVVAIREKLFPSLSEDCWVLHCDGFGGRTDEIMLSALARFRRLEAPPQSVRRVSLAAWRKAGGRLRRFLLPERGLDLYDELVALPRVHRFSDIGHAGIGYVTGANDFFHLRPTEAQFWRLPQNLLRVAARKGEQLLEHAVDQEAVRAWIANDEPVLLLHLRTPQPR